ncbi:MAG: 16S rRNA (guanine(966)-N(2))-methyltransferase RsmD [Chloroflexota bacterium]
MSHLRVISGKAKGRRLSLVPGESTRPITDRVKESLFNIIQPDISGCTFLDLFAGTGSVGIEALSRGAELVRFVDNNQSAIATIKDNILIAGFYEQAEVLQ